MFRFDIKDEKPVQFSDRLVWPRRQDFLWAPMKNYQPWLCEVSNGVYYGFGAYGLMRYSVLKIEGDKVTFEEQAPRLEHPRGPISSIMGPKGPQVFYYDRMKNDKGAPVEFLQVLVGGIGTKKIYDFPYGHIHRQSAIRPSINTPYYAGCSLSTPSLDKNRPVADSMMTWLTSQETDQTFLVDMNTGDYALLFRSILHPLFALSSTVLIAAEVTKDGTWICLVDWSLPSDLESSPGIVNDQKSRYLLPSERIKRISTLLYNENDFHFDASSNTLYTNFKGVVSYSNIFEITKSATKEFSTDTSSTINDDFAPELSKLLERECRLPSDIELIHSASSTSWKLHRDILRHHEGLKNSEDIDRMAGVIKHSNLPSYSISSLFQFIYFSSPIDQNDPIGSFMPLCHCIQLCNEIGLADSSINYLLWLLQEKVLRKIPIEPLLRNILTLWLVEQDPSPKSISTYSKTSPLMNLLASHCRIYATHDEIEVALTNFNYSNVSASKGQLAALCGSYASFLSSNSPTKLLALELSPYPPSMVGNTLKWDENLTFSASWPPENDPYTYIFTIEGLKSGGIYCSSLLLYAHWKWFERLIKTENCEEVLNRRVVMPSDFTPASLLALLSLPHGSYISTESLSSRDIVVIQRYMGRLQLSEGPCFSDLVENSRKLLFSEVNDENCLDKLHEFGESSFEFSSGYVADVLDLVLKNQDKITLKRMLSLPLRLQTLISVYAENKSHSTPEKFASMAANIDLHLASLESQQ